MDRVSWKGPSFLVGRSYLFRTELIHRYLVWRDILVMDGFTKVRKDLFGKNGSNW